MYHHTISYQVAMEKQRDMIAEANRERRARLASSSSGPQAPRRPYSRLSWRLAHALRAQAQS
jgi:hypothetical protein